MAWKKISQRKKWSKARIHGISHSGIISTIECVRAMWMLGLWDDTSCTQHSASRAQCSPSDLSLAACRKKSITTHSCHTWDHVQSPELVRWHTRMATDIAVEQLDENYHLICRNRIFMGHAAGAKFSWRSGHLVVVPFAFLKHSMFFSLESDSGTLARRRIDVKRS